MKKNQHNNQHNSHHNNGIFSRLRRIEDKIDLLLSDNIRIFRMMQGEQTDKEKELDELILRLNKMVREQCRKSDE